MTTTIGGGEYACPMGPDNNSTAPPPPPVAKRVKANYFLLPFILYLPGEDKGHIHLHTYGLRAPPIEWMPTDFPLTRERAPPMRGLAVPANGMHGMLLLSRATLQQLNAGHYSCDPAGSWHGARALEHPQFRRLCYSP